MKSYTSSHARLAAAGVNILNVVPLGPNKSVILFEYSWHDPEQEGKLHWSKSCVIIHAEDNSKLDDEILDRVEWAREELESGE